MPNTSDFKSIEILQGGEGYFQRLLWLIESAREVIHLQYYILSDDPSGREIQQALLNARSRGVEVNVLLDGVGSMNLSRRFRKGLVDAGVTLRFFSPVKFSIPFRTGRRLHLKLAVFDRSFALVGGLNIAERYRGNAEEPPWLDFAVLIEGDICGELAELAASLLAKRPYPKIPIKRLLGKPPLGRQKVEVRLNDVFQGRREIRRGYNRAISSARKSLTVVASYFLPKRRMVKLLCKAASRGVEVRLILPGQSDVLFYGTAVKYLYPMLLKSGVRLFEYQPAVLHAKAVVADDKWCSIGSFNLNDLSELLSIELNIEIFDENVACAFQERLDEIMQRDCLEARAEDYLKASTFSRFKRKLFYLGIIQSIRLLHWFTEDNRETPPS
ncbi:MAG: hypothetical protein KDC66_17825 [Phaeodactylibacter sp.]|nr:hypothetical protein [Phaeodactylibacter sp.]MCB9276013.1 hypothetical protein [Lewinellaceae bacterium]